VHSSLNGYTRSGTAANGLAARLRAVRSKPGQHLKNLQVHGSPVQGDSLTTVAGDSLDREPAGQSPDYARLAKDLDKKSPLEIMDHVSHCTDEYTGKIETMNAGNLCTSDGSVGSAGLETAW